MEKDALVSALRELTETAAKLLSGAKAAINESVEQFIEEKITKLFGLASAYRKLLERLELQTKQDFERKLQQFFRHLEVQEAYDEWQDVENEWDTLLKDVDAQLQKSGPQAITEGQMVPMGQPLVDARTGEVTSLEELLKPAAKRDSLASAPSSSSSKPASKKLRLRKEEFYALGSRLVLVSFGVREGAQQWLTDNKCPFPLLLDAQRQMYHLFGLTRSIYKVWKVSCLEYYGEQMRAGNKLPSPYENIHDDVNQMGGDFIVSAEGKLLLSHCSQSSTDRPSAQTLLSALRTSTKA